MCCFLCVIPGGLDLDWVKQSPLISSLTPHSITSLDSCVRKFKEATGCPPGEALNTASLHPAQAMGLEKSRGTLSPGAMADLAILDSDLNVQATCIAGEVVWAKPGSRFANQRNS